MSAKRTKTKPARGLGAALAEAGVTPEAYKAPEIKLVPNGIAAYAADLLCQELGHRAVKNFAFQTREAAAQAGVGFTDHQAVAEVPLTTTKAAELIPQIKAMAGELVAELRQAYGSDYIVFGEPVTLAVNSKSANAAFGPVTVGCVVQAVAGHYRVVLTVSVLSNKS